jgi:uncharacterized protein YgfB (UPF0149 family)
MKGENMLDNNPASENSESSAEINGFLCGFICSGTHSEGKLWIDSLLGYMQHVDQERPLERDVLIELYKHVSDQIQNEQFGFTLNFPRATLPLLTRATALKKWCNGFIAGLQQGGIAVYEEDNSINLVDSLKKIDHLAKLDISKIDVNEDDETMFSQVTNFIELAVMQVYRALNQGSAKH